MNKKAIAAIASAVVIAVASFFVSGTPIADAVAIVFDKEKAVTACDELLNGDANAGAADSVPAPVE